jgi:hypothetical protein
MARDKVPEDLEDIISIPMEDVLEYQNHEMGNIFLIPLKVPREADKFLDDHRHYTKSNINVCYAAPRSKSKPRKWYETQMTIPSRTRASKGYPSKGIPFFVVTDDGFGFLAHTTSDNNKQFAAVGDELILGKWLKGRLVQEGLIEPIDDVFRDEKRNGMVTQEMLETYGCNALALQKTDQRLQSNCDNKKSYEVWTLKMIWVDNDD